jgi:hypothetical protein
VGIVHKQAVKLMLQDARNGIRESLRIDKDVDQPT